MVKMGYEDPTEEETKTPQEPPIEATPEDAKETEEPAADPKKKKEETEEPAKPAEPKSRVQFDDEEATRIAEEAARKAVERSERTKEPAKPEPAPTPVSALTARQQRTLQVIQEMQENDPDYQGVPLVNQLNRFYALERDYIARWQKDNPGQKFNRSADEHNDFFATSMPDYTDDAYEDARARLEEKRIAEVESRVRGEVSEVKHANVLREEMPRIQARIHDEMATLASLVDPEISKIVVQNGKPVLNREIVDQMKEVDPLAHRVLSIESTRQQAVLTEMEMLYQFPGQYKFDGNKEVRLPNGDVIYPHREVDAFLGKLEQDLQARPANSTRRQGKQFLSSREYAQEIENIRKTSPGTTEAAKRIASELDSKYWTVDPEFFARSYTEHLAEKVKTELSELKSIVSAKPKGAQPTTKEGEAAAKPATKKPTGPTLPQPSDKTNPAGDSSKKGYDLGEQIDKKMWGL